jgi:hypothetical protein
VCTQLAAHARLLRSVLCILCLREHICLLYRANDLTDAPRTCEFMTRRIGCWYPVNTSYPLNVQVNTSSIACRSSFWCGQRLSYHVNLHWLRTQNMRVHPRGALAHGDVWEHVTCITTRLLVAL